jgi:hypothetical protein
MTNHDEYLELAAAYALEALDEESRRRFESHVASGCAICERAIRDARDAARELLYAVVPVAPAAHVKSRLLARVRGDSVSFPVKRTD